MLRRLLTRLSALSPREEGLWAALIAVLFLSTIFLTGLVLDHIPDPLENLAFALGVIMGGAVSVGVRVHGDHAAKADRERFRRVNLDIGKSVERSNVLGLITTARRRALLNHELTREQRIGAHAALTELAAAIEAGEHDNLETGTISPDAFAGAGEVQR